MPDLHTSQERQQNRSSLAGGRDGCHFRGMPIRASETEEVRRAAQRACVLDTTGAGIRRSVIWPNGYQSDEQRAFRVGISGDGTVGHPGRQPAFVGLEEAGVIRGSVLDAGCGTGENALY